MKGFALFLVLLLVLHHAALTVVQINYVWHRDFIVQTLCVEKEKKSNTCQGSCFLSEQQEQADSQTEALQTFPGIAPLFIAVTASFDLYPALLKAFEYCPFAGTFFSYLPESSLFHPPRF
jgi:hypothetical protein